MAMAAVAIASSAGAHDHARRQSWSAGEPGDPGRPARTIEVVMTEMAYEPWSIEVKRGEQIRFVIRNAGTEDHEFLLATTKENLAHAGMMKKHRHMKHAEPNAVTLAPKQSTELLWKFTKAGTFEYSCLIPDHREYGMTGRVIVK
jgi:uncharacterized cupredoxin-like copper-binding protein